MDINAYKKMLWLLVAYRWLKAHLNDRLSVWRVQYTDTAEWTRPLHRAEAKRLAKSYDGVTYIDYKDGWW